jgi:hypothetical protein
MTKKRQTPAVSSHAKGLRRILLWTLTLLFLHLAVSSLLFGKDLLAVDLSGNQERLSGLEDGTASHLPARPSAYLYRRTTFFLERDSHLKWLHTAL